MLSAALSLLAAVVAIALRIALATTAALFALVIHCGVAVGDFFAGRREDRP